MMVLGALVWIADSIMYPLNLVCSDCAKTSNTLPFSLHNESRKICQFCADKEVERIKGGSEYGNLRVCAPLWGGDRCGINFPDSDMVF